MSTLFPELDAAGGAIDPTSCHWRGQIVCKYGHPLTDVRLLPSWNASTGWTVGWLVAVGRPPHTAVLDEWTPAAPHAWRRHGAWPWYRLDEMPRSSSFAIAAAKAARACKIVLEQAKSYVDDDVSAEITTIQADMERQAQAWLRGQEHS